jgi:hypothetical protein
VAEAETDLEPPAVRDTVLFGADGARLQLTLGPDTTVPERRRQWQPEWKGPAEVLVQETGGPPAPAELAERLRGYLAAVGAPPDEVARLDLDTLVERVSARSG